MYNRYLSDASPQRLEESAAQRLGERRADAPSQSEAGLLQRLRSLLGRVGGRGETQKLFAGVPVLEKLESGDLLLILVLIFLFRESEDEEWLIILALVLLMGL